MPRHYVLAILASFCGLLIVSGLWLSHKRQIARMGWVAPGAALLAAAPLLWQGFFAKRTVLPTLAQAQVIEVAECPSHAAVHGAMALFHPTSDPTSIGADDGGTFELAGPGDGGAARRMVWTDANRWRWENVRLPAGLRMIPFQRHLTLREPVRATGTFTASGFETHWSGPLVHPGDALIAIPGQPTLAGRVDGSRILSTADDVLAAGQYLISNIMTDEQRRRQAIYRQLLSARRSGDRDVPRPTLFVWSDPLDMHFVFPDDVQRVGSSLWAIPLDIESPPIGRSVVIPSPFVQFRSVRGPKGSGVSPLYDHRTGTWVDSISGSEIWLQVQVPPEVLPFQPERARLRIEITASDRRVKILTWVDGRIQLLLERSNPIGRMEVELNHPEQLQIDDAGNLLIGILVSDLTGVAQEKQHAMWRIESVHLEISGRREANRSPTAPTRSAGDRNE